MEQGDAKFQAARRAVDFISSGMTVGLGTGTTATFFIHELGKAVAGGLKIQAVATSEESTALARALGIPITDFERSPELDVNVDGADEVGPGLALIKGGHGALLREKIVASAAKKFIVIVDKSKLVPVLGKFPLPVEVIQMSVPLVRRKLDALGLMPVLRARPEGTCPWVTDEGNFILDCHCGSIQQPKALAEQIRGIVGVVEHGLFIGMADFALVAAEDGVREIRR